MEIHAPAGEFSHQREIPKASPVQHLQRVGVHGNGINLRRPAAIDFRHRPGLVDPACRTDLNVVRINS